MRSSIIESVDFVCRDSTDTLYNTYKISSLGVFLTNKTSSGVKKHRKGKEPKRYIPNGHFYSCISFLGWASSRSHESLTMVFVAFYVY